MLKTVLKSHVPLKLRANQSSKVILMAPGGCLNCSFHIWFSFMWTSHGSFHTGFLNCNGSDGIRVLLMEALSKLPYDTLREASINHFTYKNSLSPCHGLCQIPSKLQHSCRTRNICNLNLKALELHSILALC